MSEADRDLDDLLCRWAQWARPVSIGRGFNRQALVLGQYKVSRQYDDVNGALDLHIEHEQCKAIDFEISCIPQPHYTAIHSEGRRLVVCADVFKSPRLPENRIERAKLILEARQMLMMRLTSAGLV